MDVVAEGWDVAAGKNTNVEKEQGEQQHTWEWNTRGDRLFQKSQKTIFLWQDSVPIKPTLFLFKTTVLFNMVRNIQPAPCEIKSKIELLRKKNCSESQQSPNQTPLLCFHISSECQPSLPNIHLSKSLQSGLQILSNTPSKRALNSSTATRMRHWPLEWSVKLSNCLELAVGGRPPSPYSLG